MYITDPVGGLNRSNNLPRPTLAQEHYEYGVHEDFIVVVLLRKTSWKKNRRLSSKELPSIADHKKSAEPLFQVVISRIVKKPAEAVIFFSTFQTDIFYLIAEPAGTGDIACFAHSGIACFYAVTKKSVVTVTIIRAINADIALANAIAAVSIISAVETRIAYAGPAKTISICCAFLAGITDLITKISAA